jgi:GT2 family glycosyltransferase
MARKALEVSVIVITMSRPAYVEECLRHLAALRTPVREVIVVDGSPDDRTQQLVESTFPWAVYLRHALGRGTMPESRALGLPLASGDIVAFVDDDAYVDEAWADEIVAPYADPEVLGVGGRASNGIPGEESEGWGSIGRLLPNGALTGYFAADPGRTVQVDHLLGANMSFRREALLRVGGVHGRYPGTCMCEDTDIALRVRSLGGRLVFAPAARVQHVAAPYQIGGQRFDRRYLYYSRRNHVVLLARNFGFRSPYLRRYAVTSLRAQPGYLAEVLHRLRGRPDADGNRPSALRRIAAPVILTRSLVELAGLVAGFPAAVGARRFDRRLARAS